MVQRMWAEAAGPAGGAEPLFPGSRRSRSVWDAVRLEVGGPDSCPVVLHSFTQLDPDLPRLEVAQVDFSRGQSLPVCVCAFPYSRAGPYFVPVARLGPA
ncbi:hypothetical protein J1605_019630 [Eschrichtius robustus]|uniref:Uncharacterized protein n=1 Tax=Eschrichtius robustus TaxID=9764 RepID=A0AB34HN37_ESCRO|nr:hypothetical protein J1605_019630 [Eschrichtius robustus]